MIALSQIAWAVHLRLHLILRSHSLRRLNLLDIQTMSAYVDSMNGSIEVMIGGGTPPYSYDWSNGDTGPLADSLSAGSYQLEVTDSLGCTFFLVTSVPEDTMMTTNQFSIISYGLGSCGQTLHGITYGWNSTCQVPGSLLSI